MKKKYHIQTSVVNVAGAYHNHGGVWCTHIKHTHLIILYQLWDGIRNVDSLKISIHSTLTHKYTQHVLREWMNGFLFASVLIRMWPGKERRIVHMSLIMCNYTQF